MALALCALAFSPSVKIAHAETSNTPSTLSPTKVLAGLEGRTGSVSFPHTTDVAGPDRSGAPYLFVAGKDSNTDRLPLKENSAQITIAGVIAHVRVHQLFENHGRSPLEAIYVFPASTRAAVHGMRMRIGARTVEARIDRRKTARESYETARNDGRRASLLEQERPNVFTMSVANVMPGDRIAVELEYSEMLVPENAVYELVYPAVVGPRYAGGTDPKKDGFIANPHLPSGAPEPYKFDVRVEVETGIAIKDLASPSHPVSVTWGSRTRADVRLSAPGGGNRDFVLRYRLAGDRIETGLLLWDGGQGPNRETFFAFMMEPPQRPALREIPPREYVFLLDVSGSMHGFPLDTAKTLMKNLLGRMRPQDYFNVALFSGASFVMSPQRSLPATHENISQAIALIGNQRGGGGTELLGGLQASYGIPTRGAHVSRTVVVVTDGFVGVEAQSFRFVRERLHEANLFAFGIGSSVNRALIEGLARAGQGQPFVVLNPQEAPAQAEKLRAMIEEPVLTDVAVAFNGFDAYDVAPARLPDLLSRRPLLVFGKYRGRAEGQIEVTGANGTGPFRQVVPVTESLNRPAHAPLRWLWARKWVEILEDEHHMGGGEPVENAITALGLGYNLLTPFTSFVAIDKERANATGTSETVRQPLPMPEGVSNLAVGMAASQLGGYGQGGGGLGIAKRGDFRHRMASPAAPPQTAPLIAKAASADRAEEKAPAKSKAIPKTEAEAEIDDDASGIQVRTSQAVALSDVRPLLEVVKRALATTTCAPGRQVKTFTLIVVVDAAGKIVTIEKASVDPAMKACLEKMLLGLTSRTKAQRASMGRVTLSVRLG